MLFEGFNPVNKVVFAERLTNLTISNVAFKNSKIDTFYCFGFIYVEHVAISNILWENVQIYETVGITTNWAEASLSTFSLENFTINGTFQVNQGAVIAKLGYCTNITFKNFHYTHLGMAMLSTGTPLINFLSINPGTVSHLLEQTYIVSHFYLHSPTVSMLGFSTPSTSTLAKQIILMDNITFTNASITHNHDSLLKMD